MGGGGGRAQQNKERGSGEKRLEMMFGGITTPMEVAKAVS